MAAARSPQQHSNQGKAAGLSKQDEEDLAAIDSSIERMRAFTPSDPYILTIPQDVEPRYHHLYMYQAKQWLHHTPFDPREHESTQYQTFIYHEPGRDMYMLHNSRPAEMEGNSDSKDKSGIATGASTPGGVATGGPKKTISLSAYKKKQAGATPDYASMKETEPQAKKPAVKGPVERIKADEEVLAAVEEGEDVVPASPARDEKKDLKRKRSDAPTKGDTTAEKDRQNNHADEDERLNKIPRISSPPPQQKSEQLDMEPSQSPAHSKASPLQSQHSATQSDEASIILPPKLSPPPGSPEESELPPKLSPMGMPSLPPRLSPTIPNNISATLEARARYRSVSRSSEVAGSRSGSKDPATRHLTPPPKSIPRNGFRANSSSPAVRSDAEERGRAPATSVPRRLLTPDDQGDESEEIAVARRVEKARQPPRESSPDELPPSLVVKLKFKKAQRESVRRILKMRPKPDRDSDEFAVTEGSNGRRPSRTSDARQRGRRDTNAKGVAQKVGPATAVNGAPRKEESKNAAPTQRKRSRSRSVDAENPSRSPSKRKKLTSDHADSKSQDPGTPIAANLLSPFGAQKSATQLTPKIMRKDILSAAMKRDHSTDSRLNTPPLLSQDSPSVNGTNGSQPINGAMKQPSIKTADQEAWEEEQKRLELLGKELKHAAQDHITAMSLAHSDSATALKEKKLTAIKCTESFLAYILAFICADQAAYAADPPREPKSRTWRTLQGYFGFVKRHCEPFPPLLGLACWLGVVFNARILELAARSPHEATQEIFLETYSIARRAVHDADAKLDVDALAAAFPKAWAARSRGALGSDQLEAAKSFAGPYKLPLGLQSTPLRAARAGFAMLEEWIENEGGTELYELKLRL